MSYSFEVGDTTVWSPALRVGDLYVRMVKDVAAVLDVPSGLTALASDMWDIDPDVFENLVRRMFETYFATNHQVLTGLIGGVLSPSIVILERSGRTIDAGSVGEQNFIARARNLSMSQ